MIMYYESNENRTFLQRVYDSLKKSALTFLVIIAFIVFTRFKAEHIWIPSELAKAVFGYEVPENEEFYKKETTYTEHIIFCTAFIGWFLFTIMSGVGFVALPWDIFVDYYYRPKPIDDGTF